MHNAKKPTQAGIMNKEQFLLDEYNKLNPSDNKGLIKFYEKNKQEIGNINMKSTSESYDLRTKFLCEYGLSLIGVKNYKKGEIILEEAIQLFENSSSISSEELKSNKYYEHLLWHLTRTKIEEQKPKDAIKILKQLTSYYPKNKNYQGWLHSFRERKLRRFLTPLYALCGLWFIANYTVLDRVSSNVRFVLAAAMLSVLVLTGITELYLNKKRKKISTYA